VYSEDGDNYIGNWRTGFGYINVHFPKDTTRELTAEERDKYASKVVVDPGGFESPATAGKEHAYSSHGWPCCDAAPIEQPQLVAKCGGPAICQLCKVWAIRVHASKADPEAAS
jgi:hypothetical protein